MSGLPHFDSIFHLEISGVFAHFRKFYTNSSSLTYTIPPRTAVCGLLASICEMERDTYYALFSSDNLGVAISVTPGCQAKKIMQTMNYVNMERKNGLINDVSEHKQCRLELLAGATTNGLSWQVYLGYHSKGPCATKINDLVGRIQAGNLGYGVYLGQRQFIANVLPISQYGQDFLQTIEESSSIDTAIRRDQVLGIDSDEYKIIMEMMPLEQNKPPQKSKEQKVKGRESVRVMEVLAETNGQRINGRFSNVYQVRQEENHYISFL